MQQKLRQIENQIEKIKQELQTIGPMRPGSLTKQYKQPKEKQGAYYQISYTLDMDSHTDYVSKKFVEEAKKQIKNYKRFKSLTKKWVLLSIKHSKLKFAAKSKKR